MKYIAVVSVVIRNSIGSVSAQHRNGVSSNVILQLVAIVQLVEQVRSFIV